MNETDQIKELQSLLLQLLCGANQDFDSEELDKFIKNVPRKLHEQKEIYSLIKRTGLEKEVKI